MANRRDRPEAVDLSARGGANANNNNNDHAAGGAAAAAAAAAPNGGFDAGVADTALMDERNRVARGLGFVSLAILIWFTVVSIVQFAEQDAVCRRHDPASAYDTDGLECHPVRYCRFRAAACTSCGDDDSSSSTGSNAVPPIVQRGLPGVQSTLAQRYGFIIGGGQGLMRFNATDAAAATRQSAAAGRNGGAHHRSDDDDDAAARVRPQDLSGCGWDECLQPARCLVGGLETAQFGMGCAFGGVVVLLSATLCGVWTCCRGCCCCGDDADGLCSHAALVWTHVSLSILWPANVLMVIASGFAIKTGWTPAYLNGLAIVASCTLFVVVNSVLLWRRCWCCQQCCGADGNHGLHPAPCYNCCGCGCGCGCGWCCRIDPHGDGPHPPRFDAV